MRLKPAHVSLDRPKVAPLEGGLPIGAVPYGPRSSWPLIVNALWERRGTWHALERTFQHPGSAMNSARKWCDLLLPGEASPHLELAYKPLPGNRVEVFLRIRLEDQPPLFVPDDDEEEVNANPIEAEEPEETGEEPPGSGGNVRRFSAEEVREMRLLRSQGEKLQDIAEAYGINKSTASQIVNRKTYQWVE